MGFYTNSKKGDAVVGGDELGFVQENPIVRHSIMVPAGISGVVSEIKKGVIQ